MFAFSASARARQAAARSARPRRSFIAASWCIACHTPVLSPWNAGIGSHGWMRRSCPVDAIGTKSHVSIVNGRMQRPYSAFQCCGSLVCQLMAFSSLGRTDAIHRSSPVIRQ